jgi:ribose-phosphate pyrophosphokinase
LAKPTLAEPTPYETLERSEHIRLESMTHNALQDILPSGELLGVRDGKVVEIPVAGYPDGIPLFHWEGRAPSTLLLRPKNLHTFLAAMFLVDAWEARGEHIPVLALPFIPGARQDRLNKQGDYLFTLRSIAREINARKFPIVRVLDPHSEVATALIERCHVRYVSPTLFTDSGYVGVIAPDGGAEKRAQMVATALQIPLVHAWKTRDIATGKISGFGHQTAPAGHYLIVDDICDGGGTFLGLESELVKAQITADLFVTHGLFSQGTAVLTTRFKRVITTDSIPGDKLGVVVLPQSQLLLP